VGRSKTSGINTDHEGDKIINKRFLGQHLYKRLGPISQAEAEQILARWIEQTRKAILYGERSRRTFREAAAKFLRENTHLATVDDRAQHVRDLDPFIGDLVLNQVHDQTLGAYVEARRQQGASNRRINIGLACVRRILNLAARSWRDEHGLTWLETPPLISMLDDITSRRQPYPLF
jgi:hypothetical protein